MELHDMRLFINDTGLKIRNFPFTITEPHGFRDCILIVKIETGVGGRA